MKRGTLTAAILMGSMAMSLHAEPQQPEIKLRNLRLDGLSENKNQLSLVASFDVKRAQLMDEVVFDFYLLLYPKGKEMKSQFLHCRTVHRYLEEKTGYKSSVVLESKAAKAINSRNEIFAVVVSYKGKEVGVENSEDVRWWENASLGSPVENLLKRVAQIPIVREWESIQ